MPQENGGPRLPWLRTESIPANHGYVGRNVNRTRTTVDADWDHRHIDVECRDAKAHRRDRIGRLPQSREEARVQPEEKRTGALCRAASPLRWPSRLAPAHDRRVTE